MKDGNAGRVDAGDRNIFARALVHDLRNAVAPIRNAVQLLRFRGSADANLASITDIIERQVNDIVRVLNVLGEGDRPGRGDLRSAVNGSNRGTPSSAAAAIGKHVLIVDDNAALLTSLSSVL